MAIEVLATANQLELTLNEKSDAYPEDAGGPENPVIKSAEFALLVSDDLIHVLKILHFL
jgi:hypothetical protein